MKKLDIPWISYKKNLPVDRAMPFLLDYDKNKKIQPMTEAEALSSGWMWRIPLLSRKGCGYVYSSEFISEDQAQVEAEKIVGKPIKPIKHIKFDSGRLEEVWKGNCLITGLASSFLEPLEATSIHATITQVYNFCIEHLTDKIETTVTEHNIKVYNENTIKMYENLLDFISLHYQGGRDDSKFWRFIKNERLVTPAVLDYIERAKYKIPSDLHFPGNVWGGADDLWKWSLAGLGLIDKETAKNELIYSDTYDHARTYYKIFEQSYQEELKNQPRPFEFDFSRSISSQFN
jgi:tryptophan halogenase